MSEDVLVLDSNVERRGFLYDVLTQLNYHVTTVPSFDGLVEMLNKERPACVIVEREASQCLDNEEVVVKAIREIDSNVAVLILAAENVSEDLKNKFAPQKTSFLKSDISKPLLLDFILKILKAKEKKDEDLDETSEFKGSILIVDDEEEAGTLIKAYLDRRGYDSAIALNGEEAILKVKGIKPKIVILDILMSGMDGLCVLKRMKEIDNSIFVIITTGIHEEKIKTEALKLGADTYLTKPFNLEKLEAFILASSLKKFKDRYSLDDEGEIKEK
jgi:DNA-binding response OmpR family regulator